jgi:hypothetical protein
MYNDLHSYHHLLTAPKRFIAINSALANTSAASAVEQHGCSHLLAPRSPYRTSLSESTGEKTTGSTRAHRTWAFSGVPGPQRQLVVVTTVRIRHEPLLAGGSTTLRYGCSSEPAAGPQQRRRRLLCFIDISGLVSCFRLRQSHSRPRYTVHSCSSDVTS